VILLNTCAIRDKAESRVWDQLKEIRAMRRKLRIGKKKKKKLKEQQKQQQHEIDYIQQGDKEIVVGLLGCMAERLKEKLLDGSEDLCHLGF